MKLLRYLLPVAAILLAAPAYAHFLWINVVRDTSGQPTVQLCFGEEGEPGEAHLVEPVHGHPLAEMGRGEQRIHLRLVGAGLGVFHERVHLFRGGRQTNQIE